MAYVSYSLFFCVCLFVLRKLLTDFYSDQTDFDSV